jgi:hypothetical protein
MIVLAVRAVPAIEAASATARRRAMVLAIVLLPALCAAALFLCGVEVDHDPRALLSLPEVREPAIMLAAVLAALSLALARPTPTRWALLGVVAVLDLFSPAIEAEWLSDAPLPASLERPAALDPVRELLLASGQRLVAGGSTLWADRVSAPPNFGITWDIPTLSGFNPLMMKRVYNLERMGGEWARGDPLGEESVALDMLAVRIMTMPEAWVGDMPNRGHWRRVGTVSQTVFFENDRALPRAWLVSRVASAPEDVVLWCVRTGRLPDGGRFDPRALALVEEPIGYDGAPLGASARVAVHDRGPDALEVEVETPAPAFLVLSEIDYPGWRATVDTDPQRIFTTDYALRGVAVPEGRHLVRLEFRPPSVVAGAAIGAGALAIVLLLLVLPLWRRREEPLP